jgi:glycosyltransferase involved in cell wall biosynthesis
MSAEPFVTVVTPFYNTDAYLERCIGSVLAQEYPNFEYLLVDNQSTDRSSSIAEEYAARDRRIRLVRTPRFFSQLQNYNFAVSQGSGEAAYVKIAQADDWLFPRCLHEMVALAKRRPNVGIVSSYELRNKQVHGNGLPAETEVLTGREVSRLYFLDWIFLFGSPTTVLYRADLVRSRRPFYREGSLHADNEAAFEILEAADFGFVHQVLSFTRTQDDSVTGKVRDFSPHSLDRILNLKRFGHRFLNDAEYEDAMEATLRWYYDDMGRRCIKLWRGMPSKQFWSYHEEALGTVDERIDWARLSRTIATLLLVKATSPGELWVRARDNAAGKRSSKVRGDE